MPTSPADAYGAHRERSRQRVRQMSSEGRDIGPPPPVEAPARREGCARDFEGFCRTYLPETFALPFSPDHRKAIARIEAAVIQGGLFALAMPRGSGKTTLAESAALWALLYAHRRFVVLIGAELGKAAGMLESIKVELECNDLLAADFPEVCHPIRALERIAHRCIGQTCQGEPTYLRWGAGELVLPTVAGGAASGSVAAAAGLTASIRGMKHKRPDGVTVRPDLVIPDDPQTDESARSASQCAYRERVLSGAVLGLAGPGRKIAGIMPLTVIAPGDLADRMLDRQAHPEWNGERTKLLYSFPANQKLWDRYAELRAEGLRAGDGGAAATEFYRAHRAEMDLGAQAAWPERHNPDELSAIQHAMNLHLTDPVSFASEYQNDPKPLAQSDLPQLSADAIMGRLNRHARGLVPADATTLTAFVDVQADLLYYAVCAWGPGFTGAVVDYGSYPDQQRPYFRASEARPTLAQAIGVSSLEGSLWEGLTRLCNLLLGREWPRDGGGGLRVGRMLIDSGYQADLVYRFCRQSGHAGVLLPSKGTAIGARHTPMHDWPAQAGERRGPGWVLRPAQAGRPRLLLADVNHWKSFLAARLCQALGEKGALTLFGERPAEHRLLADHLCAEYRVKTSGRGREVEEWSLRPERPDNHLLDCVVGCAVAAAIEGCALAGAGQDPAPAGRRESWREVQKRKQAERRQRKGQSW